MKKAFQTICTLFVCLIICSASFAQTKNPKKLVADETQTCNSGEKNFRVITSNEKIYQLLLQKYESKAKRQTIAYKKDRNGQYKEISVYFPVELRPEIETYLEKL